jgi:chromosome segregation ATPase
VGDAIVPGGASESPDLETLKRYLMLREQDVAALSVQLRTSKAQVKALNDQLEVERVRAVELTHETERQKQVLRDVELEKQAVRDSADSELEEMRLQMRARGDKMRLLELQVKDAALEMDQLRERVRSDLRRIRVREQELENRLELLKKDSGAQLAAREEKLNEARRKADVLEFNNELLQSQIAKERAVSQKLREQLAQVSRMVRMAGGMLAGEEGVEGSTASASKADDFLVSQSQKTSRAA